MEHPTFEEEKRLREIQHRHEFALQSNQATIDAGLKTLNGLFLINGAAATALFAQEVIPLKSAAIFFAASALIALVALATTYLFNLAIAETWQTEPPRDDKILHYTNPITGTPKSLSLKGLYRFRQAVILLGLVSGGLFVFGLFRVWILIKNLPSPPGA